MKTLNALAAVLSIAVSLAVLATGALYWAGRRPPWIPR